jgi:hypothetical protein
MKMSMVVTIQSQRPKQWVRLARSVPNGRRETTRGRAEAVVIILGGLFERPAEPGHLHRH